MGTRLRRREGEMTAPRRKSEVGGMDVAAVSERMVIAPSPTAGTALSLGQPHMYLW